MDEAPRPHSPAAHDGVGPDGAGRDGAGRDGAGRDGAVDPAAAESTVAAGAAAGAPAAGAVAADAAGTAAHVETGRAPARGARGRVRWRDVLLAAARSIGLFIVLMIVVILASAGLQAFLVAPEIGVSPVRAFTAIVVTLGALVALLGGVLSIAVTVVAIVPAWVVARALLRVRARWMHLAVWAGFGAVAGLLLVGLYTIVIADDPPEVYETLVVMAVAALAVVYGWKRAMQTRRRTPHDAQLRGAAGGTHDGTPSGED